MKIVSSTIIWAVLLISSATRGVASSSAASAQILTPATLSNTVALEFGQIGVSAVPGTVTLTPLGVRSSLGGVTLATGTSATVASFDVTGEAGSSYTITLPTSTSIVLGTDSMTIDTFASSPDTTGTLSGTGTDTLLVGATLHVGANQPAGEYAGSFNVTVLYN